MNKEQMSRGYAHNVLSILAENLHYGFSRDFQVSNLKGFVEESKKQVKSEGVDWKELTETNMPEEYTELIKAVHEGEDYEEKLDKGIAEMENIGRKYADVDFRHMTSYELKQIGFKIFENDLHLIPLYLVKAFGDDEKVTSITGQVGTLRNADLDHRMGVIAYGIKVPVITT